jgi:hypothetical protein
MKFAALATGAAAMVAVPLALTAVAPQMTGAQFLSAVRCVAYEDVARPGAELGLAKMQLNAEARRQPADTTRQAQAVVGAIALQAVNTNSPADAAMIHEERAQACADAQRAAGAAASNAA